MAGVSQYAWEGSREAYKRRVKQLTDRLNFTWYIAEREELLDRLCHVVGDPVTGPDLLVIVRAYNRELSGRRNAKLQA